MPGNYGEKGGGGGVRTNFGGFYFISFSEGGGVFFGPRLCMLK